MRFKPEVMAVKLSSLVIGFASLVPSVASAEILAVKTESANFRSGPSDKAAIVYSADKYYPVEVLERKLGWAKVKDFEGDTAWVAERVLGKMETIVIDTNVANIREKARTDSDVLFKVSHGEVFKVEERKDNWLKVKDSHGDGGWIRIDKTWGQADEKSEKPEKNEKNGQKLEEKGSLDKKGHDKVGDKNEHAKTSHEEKADVKPEKKDDSCPCRVSHDDKGDKVTHADLSDDKPDTASKPEKAHKNEHKNEHASKPQDKKPGKPQKAHAQKKK